MKMSSLKRRLRKDRPMNAITVRMPVDVISDLKRIAPVLGFSGYQPLLRHYIGMGLRLDLERLEDPRITKLVKSLKKNGVSDSIISNALEEVALP
ncbi:MAG: hypothetical protein Q7T11_09180 [Deltaproteobacteria bacterium]|nr:hypothetical protein [Deltaproteobacteria bacterium]